MLHPTVAAAKGGWRVGARLWGELAAGKGARGLTRSREGADLVRTRAREGSIHFSRACGGSAGLYFSCIVQVDGDDTRSCRRGRCGI